MDQKNDIFSTLSETTRRQLIGAMKRQGLKKDDVLFTQGHPGQTMVLIESGELAVHASKGSEPPRLVARLGQNSVVGEMSCLDPAPRSATVVATRATVVRHLDRRALHTLRARKPRIGVAVVQAIIEQVNVRIRETDELIQRNIEALEDDPPDTKSASTTKAPEPRVTKPAPFHGTVDLRKMSSLKKLSPADLEILSAAAPAKHYPGKSIICVEGAKAACCYLLISGRIDVLRKAQNKYRRLATLGPGALVGQLALVDTAPRTATLQAQTEVVVLEFARDDFKRLLDAESPLAIRFQEEVAVAGIRQLRKATAALASLPGHVRPAPVNSEGSDSSEAREKESAADSEMKETLTYMQTALKEWGMNLKDLDQIRVVKPPGQMSAAEIKARGKR